uniref:Uncharacterized protein n=1 Tax=Rhizophora mucronata TaxID=61149 RepID=A0A2P2J2H2_RHIMU
MKITKMLKQRQGLDMSGNWSIYQNPKSSSKDVPVLPGKSDEFIFE